MRTTYTVHDEEGTHTTEDTAEAEAWARAGFRVTAQTGPE